MENTHTQNWTTFECYSQRALEADGYQYELLNYILNHKRSALVYTENGMRTPRFAVVECTDGRRYHINNDDFNPYFAKILDAPCEQEFANLIEYPYGDGK